MADPDGTRAPAPDGRVPFAVTHSGIDAPDGAVLDLTGDPAYPDRTGHYERVGDTWEPVAETGRVGQLGHSGTGASQ